MSAIFDSAHARIALWEMRELPRGWDSYDACQIDDSAIRKALDLLNYLPGHWDAVPVSDGSVLLEQHRGGFDVEIRVAVQQLQSERRGK